ncbi:hypothetical protein M2212_002950 [Bradyrhizobium elkanii]|uniref:hypothetical protein n=1 Tax=Bradyrhizobium elkanii TaxID=29448 RepID=UPI00209CF5F8|nr:hypothetical protein [Bradyrhizobium elkanii]MCP1926354.1 hypothetical protein [Bradyrhizobium elkanii]MCS3476104.1 hypothetical protein [Bradyrhizobium elkanii]
MSNVTRRALRVYAALNELKGNESDVLDALTPFFEPILTLMNGKLFDPYTFSAGVRRLYRWRFTGDIASTLIPRFERKGILKKRAHAGQDTVWIVNFTDPQEDAAPPAILMAFERIIDEFEKFPPKVTDLLSYKKSREELKDILIRFLVMMDASGEGAFAPQLGELEPGAEARALIAKLEEGGTPLDPNDRYMCARFVQHLMKNRREFVPHLTRLSSIGLLAEVVEDFLKPTHVETRTDLTVILDAPIALDLLGCSGKALKDDIATVIAALKKIGASFIVFPISCIEMQHNLRSMLSLPPEQRRGYTHNAMIKREIGLDFVQAVANNPERALDNIGITVRQIGMDTFPHNHRYFTLEQHDDFLNSITWGNNVNAREHDATCLTLTARLREGKQNSDVFKTRFVMVTRNTRFVGHARNYALQSRMINPLQEGPIIHARDLATTAWLRTGLGADETIPRGHLIATCDRVLQVKPEVRNALANQLALVTPERLEQLNLLLLDARSVQKLADQTLNNENIVTSENAEHLLDVMREATAEELRGKHEAQLATERQAAAESLQRASSEVSRLSDQLAALQMREAQALALKEGQLKGVVGDVNKQASGIEFAFLAVLLVLGIAGGINFFTSYFDGHWIWNSILMLAGSVSFARLVFGLLERPMPALATLLNYFCRNRASKKLSALGLSDENHRLGYKAGRIMLVESKELIVVEKASKAPKAPFSEPSSDR